MSKQKNQRPIREIVTKSGKHHKVGDPYTGIARTEEEGLIITRITETEHVFRIHNNQGGRLSLQRTSVARVIR